jgi:hypothetical protein
VTEENKQILAVGSAETFTMHAALPQHLHGKCNSKGAAVGKEYLGNVTARLQ